LDPGGEPEVAVIEDESDPELINFLFIRVLLRSMDSSSSEMKQLTSLRFLRE
jgi:hypothetical protein